MIDCTIPRSVSVRRQSGRFRRFLPGAAIIIAGAFLASCSQAPKPKGKLKEYFSQKEYGVAASPRVVAKNKAIPKGGGRYHVGKPYKIKGKTYRPREDSNYSAVGLASWYGSAFHGRKTANGEIYDMGELTAAHPTLPLPSYVRVTNLSNKRSVVVRVNDRGPFAKGRIIDVSATVAQMLGFKKAGTAKVKVDYIRKASLDGQDRKMLVASYKGPKDSGGRIFASAEPTKPIRSVVASLSPESRGQRAGSSGHDGSIDLFGAQRLNAPAVTAPAFMPNTFNQDDPLAPLIVRAGSALSYAPSNRFSRAHLAAAEMAQGGRSSATIQIGTFGDRANAERIGPQFSKYGRVETRETISSGRTLYIVRVVVDSTLSNAPDKVIAAAHAAGIADAFVVAN